MTAAGRWSLLTLAGLVISGDGWFMVVGGCGRGLGSSFMAVRGQVLGRVFSMLRPKRLKSIMTMAASKFPALASAKMASSSALVV